MDKNDSTGSELRGVTIRLGLDDWQRLEALCRVPTGGRMAKAEAVRVALREAAERRGIEVAA